MHTHSPPMDDIREIFVSVCDVLLPMTFRNDADRQYRRQLPTHFQPTPPNTVLVHVIFCVWKKVLIYFIVYIYLKRMWRTYRRIWRWLFSLFSPGDVTDLWKSTAFQSSTQLLLEFTLRILSLVHILRVHLRATKLTQKSRLQTTTRRLITIQPAERLLLG